MVPECETAQGGIGMKPRSIPLIPIIEEYIQYRANRRCYTDEDLRPWRYWLIRVFLCNDGEISLTSAPLDSLDFGTISHKTQKMGCDMIRGFRDWYGSKRVST